METGLKFLVSGGLATSSVFRKVNAESLLDSSRASSDIIATVHGSMINAVRDDCAKVAKVALCVGVAYAAWKAGSLWVRRRPVLQNAIVRSGEEVMEHITVGIDEDEDSDAEDREEIIVGSIGIGVSRNVSPERKLKRRHRSKPFIRKIVHLTKNHFGGCPESSKSNVMAVSKFVYDLCKQHNCLPHQTRMIISVAVPLVLSPDMYDISSRALLNSETLNENRAKLDRLKTLDGWLSNLICHPLSAKAWRRTIDNLCGLPDWKAFRLIN